MMELLTSILGGGATGLLGTVLSGGLSFFGKRQEHKHRLEMREMDMRELQLEMQSAERQQALKLESVVAQGEMTALAESYKSERSFLSRDMRLTPTQQWLIVFVDLVRGLMRPSMTLFFIFMSYLIWKNSTDGAGEIHTVESTILYLTTTCVLWWFGSRQVDKRMKG